MAADAKTQIDNKLETSGIIIKEHALITPEWYKEAMRGAQLLEKKVIVKQQKKSELRQIKFCYFWIDYNRLQISIKGKLYMGEEGSTQLSELEKLIQK